MNRPLRPTSSRGMVGTVPIVPSRTMPYRLHEQTATAHTSSKRNAKEVCYGTILVCYVPQHIFLELVNIMFTFQSLLELYTDSFPVFNGVLCSGRLNFLTFNYLKFLKITSYYLIIVII